VGLATREVSVTGERATCNESNRIFPEPACYDSGATRLCRYKPMMTSTEISENLQRIRERIHAAAIRASRAPDEVTLIGVSKTHPADAIQQAFQAGLRHFGENRVQEWEGKRGGIVDLPATWHLIGHLQSNKAAKAAKLFHCIDSVDDFALAQRLNRTREEIAATEPLRVLIEVHMGEESKSGVPEGELSQLARRILELPKLHLAGLMTIPPYLDDPESVRPYFAKVRQLKDSLEPQLGRKLSVLSMGMSHDFEAAIGEGATEVRVGTALFGTRASHT
jgi:PLP dependent protein